MIKEYRLAEHKITAILPNGTAKCPIVYVNTLGNELSALYKTLARTDTALIGIEANNWNDELSPWAAEKVFKRGEAFGGGGEEYLRVLCEEIILPLEAELGVQPSTRSIAGYSLAGLFAVYALCQTPIFDSAASVSGSLWFPNFAEYVEGVSFAHPPRAAYFSVGDREAKTNSPLMSQVQVKTEQIFRYFESLGTRTKYELNSGNHFVDSDARTAKGISFLLE